MAMVELFQTTNMSEARPTRDRKKSKRVLEAEEAAKPVSQNRKAHQSSFYSLGREESSRSQEGQDRDQDCWKEVNEVQREGGTQKESKDRNCRESVNGNCGRARR